MCGLDERRVLNSIPWKLRESMAEFRDALGLHLEVALLSHRCVPTAAVSDTSLAAYGQSTYIKYAVNKVA